MLQAQHPQAARGNQLGAFSLELLQRPEGLGAPQPQPAERGIDGVAVLQAHRNPVRVLAVEERSGAAAAADACEGLVCAPRCLARHGVVCAVLL